MTLESAPYFAPGIDHPIGRAGFSEAPLASEFDEDVMVEGTIHKDQGRVEASGTLTVAGRLVPFETGAREVSAICR